MRLADFVNTGAAPLDAEALAPEVELVRDVQGRLSAAGLLDPPIDGSLGPVSLWALTEFAERMGLSAEDGLSVEIGKALLTNANETFKSAPAGGDLASRLAAAMDQRGYWMSRHPDCFNIVYVEGVEEDGKPNGNAPNRFNDMRYLLQFASDGTPRLSGAWQATTEPGKHWTDHPKVKAGAARIEFGQYKAWSVGMHHPNSASRHEALVQVDKITIRRDLNKDYKRDGDLKFTGDFAINQHWGYDLPANDIGKAGAGCLIGRTKQGHRDFMALVKTDPRHLANSAYKYMTAVLDAAALSGAPFDPASPH